MSLDIKWSPLSKTAHTFADPLQETVGATISRETARNFGVEISKDEQLLAVAQINDSDKIRRVLQAHADLYAALDKSDPLRKEWFRIHQIYKTSQNDSEATTALTQLNSCEEAINQTVVMNRFLDVKKKVVEQELRMRTPTGKMPEIDSVAIAKYATPEQRAYFFEHRQLLQEREVISLIQCGVTEKEKTILAEDTRLYIPSALAKAKILSAAPLAPPSPSPFASAPADKGDSKTS